MMTIQRIIALDVGGSRVKSAIVTTEGHLVTPPLVTPIDSTATAEIILSTLSAIVHGHLQQTAETTLLGVACGFPGPFDYDSGVCHIRGVAKFDSIYGLNIKNELQSRLGWSDLSIVFRNDAEAAIMGEALYGAGRPFRRLIGVTLGTGCGSAFVAEGQVVMGGEGVPPQGWLYPVLFQGRPADDVFSSRGLEARLRGTGVMAPDIAAAATTARSGDGLSARLFAAFGADLGLFLQPFVSNFGAEAVLVLGGIGGAFDLFGPALGQGLPVPVLPGERPLEAALLGAAALLFGA